MFGSGENTVAPTSILPSRSFCFAVLKIRAGAFCCCACAFPSCASPSTIQVNATRIAVTPIAGKCAHTPLAAGNEREYRVLIGFFSLDRSTENPRLCFPLSFLLEWKTASIASVRRKSYYSEPCAGALKGEERISASIQWESVEHER